MCSIFSLHVTWNWSNLEDGLLKWISLKVNYKDLHFFIFWEIWKMHNIEIFQDFMPSDCSFYEGMEKS